jgi:hypothetical protein
MSCEQVLAESVPIMLFAAHAERHSDMELIWTRSRAGSHDVGWLATQMRALAVGQGHRPTARRTRAAYVRLALLGHYRDSAAGPGSGQPGSYWPARVRRQFARHRVDAWLAVAAAVGVRLEAGWRGPGGARGA